jgi:glycosyltransferase involved in cell wall biosynthesis
MAGDVKYKICFICYLKKSDPVLKQFSRSLSNAGYDVTMLSILDAGQKEFETRNDRKIYRINMPFKLNNRMRRFLFFFKSIIFVRKYQFSIIHIHFRFPYFALFKVFSLIRATFIVHIVSAPSSKPRLKKKIKKIIIFLQCMLMDKVIIQSEELKHNWIGLRNLKKAEIIPVGFDRKTLYPVDHNQKYAFKKFLNIGKHQTVLVYCGAIAKLRELNRLLKAFKIVCEIIPDVKLLMIGDGDALKEMKDFSKRLEIENHVIFTGRVPHEKIRNYFAVADVGIAYVPIKDKYNFNPPLKTFEYLACGLPSIATATISNRKIIQNGFNGILVNDNAHQIALAIVNLLNDKNLQVTLSANARGSILANDFDNITRTRLIPLYEELL